MSDSICYREGKFKNYYFNMINEKVDMLRKGTNLNIPGLPNDYIDLANYMCQGKNKDSWFGKDENIFNYALYPDETVYVKNSGFLGFNKEVDKENTVTHAIGRQEMYDQIQMLKDLTNTTETLMLAQFF